MKPINDLTVEDSLYEAVQIEPLALQEEFIRTPRDLAYWNERYRNANQAFLESKIELERVEARQRIWHRERLVNEGGKVTESMVDAAVAMDDELYAARMEHVKKEVEKTRVNGVLDAIRAKRDSLISIGAHVRAEMGHDPTIRGQHAARAGYSRGDDGWPSKG